jgi:hypothetical protein
LLNLSHNFFNPVGFDGITPQFQRTVLTLRYTSFAMIGAVCQEAKPACRKMEFVAG